MIKKIWDNLEENVLIASYIVIIPILFMQVIMRYVFSNSLAWSEELARYIFIWQVWLGSSYAVQKGRHIRIDVVSSRLPVKAKFVGEIIITLICIAFCGFFCYKGLVNMNMVGRLHQTSPALKIPLQVLYACVPISTALMVLRYLEMLVTTVKTGIAGTSKEE